jgi:DNA-binding response OmpR family regulator
LHGDAVVGRRQWAVLAVEEIGMERRPVVLVVDDDADIAALMRDFLEADGYEVMLASDGRAALAVLDARPVDCVVLDIMMSGLSGFDVLRQVRAQGDTPVLLLSALQEDGDKLRGLSLGADDYIVKSATPAEVVLRVRAVLRRSHSVAPPVDAVLDYGRLIIDVRAHEVRVDGAPVALTAREFELLEYLASHPRQIFTRDQLFEQFWGEVGDRHTLTVHISRLREKIEEDPSNPVHIVTVWGVGYRFEGERRR